MHSESTPARVLRWLGLGVLALSLLFAAALLLFDWNMVRPYLSAWVSGQTGREFTVQDLEVDLSLRPTVTLNQVTLENAEWGLARPMLTARLIQVRVDLRRLLHGEVILPHVRLEGANLLLQRAGDGQSNWDFVPGPLTTGPSVEPVLPKERPELPRVDRFRVGGLEVDYRSPAYEADLNLNRVQGRLGGGPGAIWAAGSGTLRDKPLEFSLRGGDLQTLRSPDARFPVAVDASLGDARLDAQGTILDPLGVGGLDLNVTMSGADLANLHAVIPLPLPSTPVYRLKTQIQRDRLVWNLRNLSGAIGRTDLSGDLSIDLKGERLGLRGELSSRQVVISDLQGIVGAPPRRPDLRPDRLFPHRPIHGQYLEAADVRIRYQADEISGLDIPLTSVTGDILLQNGLLTMRIEQAGVAGGSASGTLRLAAEPRPPGATVDMRFSGIRISQLLPTNAFIDASSGRISGHAELTGAGASVAGLLGESNGSVYLAMSGGSLDNAFIEAIGLDVAELLLVLSEEGSASPIRCAAGIVRIKDGIARPDPFVIDSRDSLVEVTGQVNLETEALDLKVEAHAKDPSLFTAQGAIDLTGTILSPRVGIDPGTAIGQALGAAALAALVNPLAAVAAFIDPGTAEDAACGALLQKVRK